MYSKTLKLRRKKEQLSELKRIRTLRDALVTWSAPCIICMECLCHMVATCNAGGPWVHGSTRGIFACS